MAIEVRDVSKKFGKRVFFSDINVNVSTGDIFIVSGPSGCGKTTLLNMMSTLDCKYDGRIEILGKDPKKMSFNELADFRNKQIGIVFQSHNLLPEFSVIENIAMPLYIAGICKNEANIRAQELALMLSISDCQNNFPNEISGGQSQRAAFARAIINKPNVVFADEPTGSLDKKNANDIHSLILELNKSMNITFVISTHCKDLESIASKKFDFKDQDLSY